MQGKQLVWNKDLFDKTIRLVERDELLKKISGGVDEDEISELELEKNYPLDKNMLGVKIEYGILRVQRCTIDEALELLDSFVIASLYKKHYEFEPIGNINKVIAITEKYKLEKPNLEAVQGYILNKELVKFIHTEDQCYIRLKYKDNPENIFYIYKFYFLTINNELFLCIEKNI